MKAIARCYMYWPNIDKDLENAVHSCSPCQQSQDKPARLPLHHWPTPDRPWSTLHADYLGPLKDGKMILVLIDAYTKYIDAFICSSSTSEVTIKKMKLSFSTHGLCDTLVTDNGPCFASAEFEQFTKTFGIKHVRTAPFHPASNGLAEKAVHIVKKGISKIAEGSLEAKLIRVLFKYRNTPHSTTNETPAKLLFGRQPITPLDRIRPSLKNRVEVARDRQKLYHDKCVINRQFRVGDEVFVWNYGKGDRWLPGRIVESLSPVTFRVRLVSGVEVKKHADQMRECKVKELALPRDQFENLPLSSSFGSEIHKPRIEARRVPASNGEANGSATGVVPTQGEADVEFPKPEPTGTPGRAASGTPARSGERSQVMPPSESASETVLLRRSGRVKKAPMRLDL